LEKNIDGTAHECTKCSLLVSSENRFRKLKISMILVDDNRIEITMFALFQ